MIVSTSSPEIEESIRNPTFDCGSSFSMGSEVHGPRPTSRTGVFKIDEHLGEAAVLATNMHGHTAWRYAPHYFLQFDHHYSVLDFACLLITDFWLPQPETTPIDKSLFLGSSKGSAF